MSEEQKLAVVRLIQELRNYLNSLESDLYVPNNSQELRFALDNIEKEFSPPL